MVHSRAFRRLEAKTQVFSPGLSDHFRNRLTHTIEVSQIARTLARVLELDEDLTEALALAHDIGHPPFAHAGEEELNRQMARFGERFDHNLHALRIVETFEQRYARFPGLNLTSYRYKRMTAWTDYAPAGASHSDLVFNGDAYDTYLTGSTGAARVGRYEMGALLVCPECGHEWEAAAAEETTEPVIKDASLSLAMVSLSTAAQPFISLGTTL